MKLGELTLYRSNSRSSKSSKQILPSNYIRSSSQNLSSNVVSETSLVRKYRITPLTGWNRTQNVVELIKSLVSLVSFSSMIPTCRWMDNSGGMMVSAGSVGRKVTGTLYGYKKGHVTFAVQEDPRSEPVLLLELATSTSMLVKEMSSGLVRIALECDKGSGRQMKLLQEPVWTMYCNGRRCGQAVSRTCVESDWYMLSTVQTVSAGAGVIPGEKGLNEGELMYMRARFDRVTGSRNSQAYYMVNPDSNGGPELSIFLLRF